MLDHALTLLFLKIVSKFVRRAAGHHPKGVLASKAFDADLDRVRRKAGGRMTHRVSLTR